MKNLDREVRAWSLSEGLDLADARDLLPLVKSISLESRKLEELAKGIPSGGRLTKATQDLRRAISAVQLAVANLE